MFTKLIASCTAIVILLLFGPSIDAVAAENPALNVAILRLALDWEHIKFEVENRDVQEQQMAGLAQRAAEMARQYQDRPAATIWYGIILSEQASMAGENGSPFKALGFAKRARDLLEKAEKIDSMVLDAGAPTSLGVLYYRVPGFPIGFGDKTKARHLLEEAVRNAPNGLDANYFYGDFLYEQREFPRAEAVLKRVLTLPAHPDRPIWDRSRRLVATSIVRRGTVLGIDHSAAMCAKASRHNREAVREGRAQLRQARFDALPRPAESIGKVLAVNVAYFFRPDGAEIREARRVLRPGGTIVMYATDKTAMAGLSFSKTHQLFDQNDLADLLVRGGFAADAITIRPITVAFGIPGLLAVAKKRTAAA